MWSEYCFYKNLKLVLKKFWMQGEQVFEGFGEGVGIIDIGDGQVVVFKVESYNYLFVVEFYEGVVMGVGGIIWDIFLMGVWLIVLLDSFCFGELIDVYMKYLIL